MKNFKLWNTVCGWIVFAIAAATYLLTMEPTASFWDCGEFISSAAKLDVGHPPGAPFFMLMGHFFSLFASDVSHVAMCVNALSALASAFTILFLFWTITALAKKLVEPDSLWKGIGLLGAGAVGALAYTFSDTFWFSAVEGEVYASSSFFTAVVFWLILKWDEHADEAGADRWLIAIAYLMGLSIGVHLLNLLTIPAIGLVYYFRRYRFTWMGFVWAFLASCAVLLVILYGIIPGFPTVAGWFELLFVNGLHCPYNTGLAVYIVLTVLALAWAVIETYLDANRVRVIVSFVLAFMLSGAAFLFEKWWMGLILGIALVLLLTFRRDAIPTRVLNTTILMIAVILVGYSSYAAIVIRSNAQTPMDQNSPRNVFALKYYLNREQYGDRPLFYGQTYSAPLKLNRTARGYEGLEYKNGEAQYAPRPHVDGKPDEYIVTGHKIGYKYQPEFCTIFPRMYSSQGSHINAYKSWAGIRDADDAKTAKERREINKENKKRLKTIKSGYIGNGGWEQKADYCPTFVDNMRFFFNYQVHFMYWRYFMWNFVGRQNDLLSYGDITKGQWISGIPKIDNARLGDQSLLPTDLKENKAHNVYYFLPLLLGLIGIFWQITRRGKDGSSEGGKNFTLTFLLFFLTGLAIVIYLNQTPEQPRERDYAYAGSFYAFCIWIGLGALALIDWINKALKSESGKAIVAICLSLLCLGVPALMASQNWDDHDRSDRYVCRDFGANYLNSCEAGGILFSNGDNDTFPLWYNQEVEGVGDSLRVCNLSYLNTEWYIDQMKRPYYGSEGLPISWEQKDYMADVNAYAQAEDSKREMSVKDAFAYLRSKKDKVLPTNRMYVSTPSGDKIFFSSKRGYNRSEMMIMEMLSTNNWQRPMYFCASVGNSYYLGLEPWMELTGLAYQITPERSRDGQPRVNSQKMYENMIHKFKYGNVNKPGIYLDENTLRMCYTHRQMLSQLAEQLFSEHQNEKAIEVLDFCEEQLPGYNIPHNEFSSYFMVALYFDLKEDEKALAIAEQLGKTCAEYMRFAEEIGEERRQLLDNYTFGRKEAILSYLDRTCRNAGYKDFVSKIIEEL